MLAAIAPPEDHNTVLAVPATGTLTDRFNHQARLRRLGRIGVTPAAEEAPQHLSLLREHKALPSPVATLPAGAATRQLDADGRMKLGGDLCLSELLGWVPGALEVRCDGYWLVLTQPAHLVGIRRTRNSSYASFSVTETAKGAVERLALPPAQRQRVTSPGCDSVLVIPVPHSSSLLLVNPVAVLGVAPHRSKCCSPPTTKAQPEVPDEHRKPVALRSVPGRAVSLERLQNSSNQAWAVSNVWGYPLVRH